MWAAQGFIQAQGARRIDEIGMEYFNELCSRCLLQISSTGEVKLHDFIHAFARLVSANFCLCVDDMSRFLNVSSTVRHVCLLYQVDDSEVLADLFKKCCTYKKLRTFMLVSHLVQPPRGLLESELFEKFFQSFHLLRVLDLSGSGIRRLSNSVGNNACLHYLNLSGTRIKVLPEGVGNLIGLETFNLLDGPSIVEWPSNFEKLTKLRHLYYNNYNKQGNGNMPRALGKLTRLETLHTFVVKSEEGYEIEELKDMNCLCGSILIRGLENVKDFHKAKAAMLENKKFLDKLELQWAQQREPTDETMNVDKEVLRGLKPHNRLTELEIKAYHGASLPDWLGNASCKLEKLVIDSCVELVGLPSLHLTSLKKLEIQSCPKLVSLPLSGLPISLENLNILGSGIIKQQCEQGGSDWEKIRYIPIVEIDGQRIPTLPSPMP